MSTRRLKLALCGFIVALAIYRAWFFRYDLVNDTVSYMDMGDELFAGRPLGIVNGTWGPLYAVLLGMWLHAFRPSPRWEYPAVHVLMLLVFFATIASFDFYYEQLLRFKRQVEGRAIDAAHTSSERALVAIGYAVFGWSTLTLIGVEETNPDMILAALFFVACGCLLRIGTGDLRLVVLLGFGGSIGLGYLTKAAMLPIGCILLACAAFASGERRTAIRVGLFAGLTTLVLCAPQVAALSANRGHFATSDTGSFNYAVHVQGVTYRHWQGETPDAGKPLHPTRKLLDRPAVFEFDGPLPGTYPLWFDISYWYVGVKNHVYWRREAEAIWKNGKDILGVLFDPYGAPLVIGVILQWMASRDREALRRGARYWLVLVPAFIALGPYVLVHFEPRYIGGFVCVLLTCAIASASIPEDEAWVARLYWGCAVAAAVIFFGPYGPAPTLVHRPAERTPYWRVAAALDAAGYGPGTKVATLEYANMSSVLWARLDGAKIVAEVYYRPDRPETDRNLFWTEPEGLREDALTALHAAGARVAVTEHVPVGPGADRWMRLADSDYYYRAL